MSVEQINGKNVPGNNPERSKETTRVSSQEEVKKEADVRIDTAEKKEEKMQMMLHASKRSEKAQAQKKDPENDAQKEQDKLTALANEYRFKEASAITQPIAALAKTARTIPKELGYISTIQSLIYAVQDNDEWLPDSYAERDQEQELLINAVTITRTNIEELRTALDAAPDGPGKETLRQLYIEKSGRLTELMGNMDKSNYSADIRDAKMMATQARETLAHMTTDEAITWVRARMAQIDETNWQSKNLANTYKTFAEVCKQQLKGKLGSEEKACGTDPQKQETYRAHCRDVAKIFSDSDWGIDNNLTDFDFAEEMAQKGMGFDDVALRYAERNGHVLEARKSLEIHVEKAQDIFRHFTHSLGSEKASLMMGKPEVIKMMDALNGKPTSITAMAEQYSVACTMEELFAGLEKQKETGVPYAQPQSLEENIKNKFTSLISTDLEKAHASFNTFITNSLLKPGWTGVTEINAAIGEPPLTPSQVEGFTILKNVRAQRDISGTIVVAKIGASVAAGIALGVVTGGAGCGVVASMLIGGVGATVTDEMINQRHTESLQDVTDLTTSAAINIGTAGVGKYLDAARAIAIARKTGVLSKDSAATILKNMGTKAGQEAIEALNASGSVTTRILGTTVTGAIDSAVSAGADTLFVDGTFMENFQNNLLFMGLAYAEFLTPMTRRMGEMNGAEADGLKGLVSRATDQQKILMSACEGTNLHPQTLIDAPDLSTLLKDIDATKATEITKACETMKSIKKEFEAALTGEVGDAWDRAMTTSDAPDTPSAAARNKDWLNDPAHPRFREYQDMKQTIMNLPDTPEGLAKRIEAAEYLLGIKNGSMDPAKKEAILQAHAVPMSGVDAKGEKFYTSKDLSAKMNILVTAGFTPGNTGEADLLMRMGVCGTLFQKPGVQPIVVPQRKNPATSPASPSSDATEFAPRQAPPPAPVFVPRNNAAPRNIPPPPPPPPKRPAESVQTPTPSPSTVEKKNPEVDRLQTEIDTLKQQADKLGQQIKAQGGFSKAPAALLQEQGRIFQNISKKEAQLKTVSATPTSQSAPAPQQAPSTRPQPITKPQPAPVTPPQTINQPQPAPAAPAKKADTPQQTVANPATRPAASSPSLSKSPSLTDTKNTMHTIPERQLKWLQEYGHLTPEQAKIDPVCQQKLQELRDFFGVEVYYEGGKDGWEFMDGARFNGKVITKKQNLRTDYLLPGQTTDYYTGGGYVARELQKDGIHELVVYKPLSEIQKVGERTVQEEVDAEGLSGFLGKKKMIEHQVPIKEMRPLAFNQVANNTSQERAVRITYTATGNDWQTNMISTNHSSPESPHISKKDSSHADISQEQQDLVNADIIRAQKIQKNTKGRPGNFLHIAVVLPESQAKEFMKMLKEHPKDIRGIFLSGGQDRMMPHNPPPFEKWDKEPNAGKMRIREWDGDTPKDTDVQTR